MDKYFPLSALVLVVACSTPSTVEPLSIPLEYKTMAALTEFPTLPACAAVPKIVVNDARDDKTIGKRFVEGRPSAGTASVTASNDIKAWVSAGAENALRSAGAPVAKSGAPVLLLRIDQLNTKENVLRRSGYEGRILISAELRPAAGGAACWNDRFEGSAENYGYSGSIANYQETLNHALDRAMIRVLSAPDFKKSICACGGA